MSNSSYTLTVTVVQAGRTIKSILLSDVLMSRRLVRQLAHTGQVLRNGEAVYLTQRTVEGDEISVMLPTEESNVLPETMPLEPLYEDSEIIVVNKSPGILTHPTARERNGSLLAGVRAGLPQGMIPHCVHRLDRDTSGLVMFAKHSHAHQLFDRSLRNSGLHRVYVAISQTLSGFHYKENVWHTIDLPIAQDPEHPSKRIISLGGQRALTHFRIVRLAQDATLSQVVLETGRTHQIRLHMATIGLPLVGDKDYGHEASRGVRDADQHQRNHATLWGHLQPSEDPSERPESDLFQPTRQMLHAMHLGWVHPVSQKFQLASVIPPLDMRHLWQYRGGDDQIWIELLKDSSAWLPIEMLL